jgi:hypothetical protein
MTTPRDPIYAGCWLYFRFPLSLRMGDEMLAAQGILVTYETIRQWVLKLVGSSPTVSVGELPAGVTNGILMRWSSASPAGSIGSGEQSTRRASFWTSWCRAGATRRLPNPYCASY